MRYLVTGGAGFIGSHLCDALLAQNHELWCVDNLRLGRMENIQHLMSDPGFHFQRLDLVDFPALEGLLAGTRYDAVFHLAANSDIQAGLNDVDLDLRLNFLTTFNLLKAMQALGPRRIMFASTSAVFGETLEPLPENYGPLRPVSLYGASKLAAEAYLSAFQGTFGFQIWLLRFPNVVGERSTHGAIHDFIHRLRSDPSRLRVLGDGSQAKPYLYVKDLVRAISLVVEKASEPLAVYHVGNSDLTTVRQMAEIVLEEMGLQEIPIEYSGGRVGWVGDVPRFEYETSKIKALGFTCRYNSTESVRIAARRILGKP